MYSKIDIREDKHKFEIYQETKIAIISTLVTALLVSAFSAGILYWAILENETPFIAFGFLMCFVSVLMLLSMPKFYRQIKENNGNVSFIATKAGFTIIENEYSEEIFYSWNDVAQISLTNHLKSISKDDFENYRLSNVAIVRLKRNISAEKTAIVNQTHSDLRLSPNGDHFTLIKLPNDKLNTVRHAISQFSSNQCDVFFYSRVEHNFKDGTEKVTD